MALIAPMGSSPTGVAYALVAANAGGDSFRTNGRERYHVKNGGGGSVTVTFASPNPCNFGLVGGGHSWAVVVGAGAEVLIGPFPPAQFADANGNVQVTYSGVTSVTVGVE